MEDVYPDALTEPWFALYGYVNTRPKEVDDHFKIYLQREAHPKK